MSTFKNKSSTEVNESHTNFESETDSDFYDDCDKEESDDEDDFSSARIRSWRAGYFTPRIFEFNTPSGINRKYSTLKINLRWNFLKCYSIKVC
jgi:hypothetical protein